MTIKVGMPTQLHNFVRFVRVSRGLSQAQFAKELRYAEEGRHYISKVERGVYKLPLDFVTRMMKLLKPQEVEHLHEILTDFRQFRRAK